jgi:hypothetical protein
MRYETQLGSKMTGNNLERSQTFRDACRHVKILAVRDKLVTFGALLLCAMGVILYVSPQDPPAWDLRTTFHIGKSADPELAIEGYERIRSGIEGYRSFISVISSPAFREKVASAAEFEPESAVLSKRLVFNTLRAYASNDYDIEVELTSASAADCRAALRVIVDQIEQRHRPLFDRSARMLGAAVDDYRKRADQLKNWADAGGPGDPRPDIAKSWSETRERLRRLEAAVPLVTPTRPPDDAEIYLNGPLSTDTVRLSAMAGLALILCIIILALGLDTRRSITRGSEK